MKNKKYYLNPIYDPNNNKAMSINYKKIKLWTEYFYRFEKGENEKNYLNRINMIINNYEKQLDKKQRIIEEMAKFILNRPLEIDSLSQDCREEMEKYIHQSDIKISFEILDPTKSIINMKKKNY